MSAVSVRGWAGALGWSVLVLCGSASASPRQTPDVIVYDVGVDGSNPNNIHYYGQFSGIAAYSIATQACNRGTAPVDWFSGASTLHPVIAQNMFRLKDGRFEQLGQSWLKHGFCAVNEVEAECAPCQSTPCSSLGVGCADTYWATLNDGASGQSKRHVNAATGSHVHGGGPTGNATIRGRLQVAVADIDPAQNPGAEYFIEGHYVTADDSAAGVSANNASWRRVNVISVSNIDGGGPTEREFPAIYAWQSMDPGVEIKAVQNIEDAGTKTIFYLGYRVTDLGGNRWHYEYALQNLNSDQSAGSFSVPVEPTLFVTAMGFHDVAYHSGDPYDGTDWSIAKFGGEIRWATVPFSTDPDANALRWGTLYNFRFDAASPPVSGPVTIGLFKPSVNTHITVDDVLVPSAASTAGKTQQHVGPPPPAGSVGLPFTDARNGSHVNPSVLLESAPAIVGREWRAAIELAGVERTLLYFSLGGPTEGTFNRLGEVLIRPPIIARKSGDLALPIPHDARLVGFTFSTQAAVRLESGWRLTNALDVTIGSSD